MNTTNNTDSKPRRLNWESTSVRHFELTCVCVETGRWAIHERNSTRGYMFQGYMFGFADKEAALIEFTRKAAVFGWNVASVITS
jgi:hypothetical protein